MKMIKIENVDVDIIQFIFYVFRYMNLNDWCIEFWDIEGENECVDDMKIIYLYNSKDLDITKLFFLHEVAHVLTEGFEENMLHKE